MTLVYISLVFTEKLCAKSNSYCPDKWCICDTYEDLNRANCSSQNLLNADIGMSKHVEILDLSNNFITTLDDKCFKVIIS